MTWITTIPYAKATGRLKQIYDRLKGPDDRVDNILLAHSLRPHSLEGHLALYKNVLHHSGNRLDKSFLEAVGVYVSLLNKCDYCVDHHRQGMNRLLQDEKRADALFKALKQQQPEKVFPEKQAQFLRYAEKLTLNAGAINEQDIKLLKEISADDGEILEVNQVTAYFNYANRTVLGLGVTTKGDILGLSPNNSDDNSDWSHQ